MLYERLFNSIQGPSENNFAAYQRDPVGFGEDVLGERYTEDVQRMMLSVRDNVITIAKSSNATGKTHGAARMAVWWKRCFPDAQVYTAAAPPESNLKKLLWGEIGSILEKHPDLFPDHVLTNLHLQQSAKSFLTGVTIPSSGTESVREAKFSGKHSPHLMFILDEADAIPDEVYRGIETCMTGGHVRLLCMFNPRSELGEVARMEREGRANVVKLSAFNHPNVIHGTDIIPGAVTRETTVRRINEWCRPLVPGEVQDRECFELPAYLIGCTAKSQAGIEYPPLRPGWYKVMQPIFSYSVLGEYPAQAENQLISKEWVYRARSRWDSYVAENGERPPVATSAIMGLDVAEFGADSNVAAFRYGGYVEPLVTWGGVDLMVTGDRAADEYKKRNVIQANIDATGLGAGVAPHMQRHKCAAVGVKVASSPTKRCISGQEELGEFYMLRDELYWEMREWLRVDPGAMLPPDEMLLEELLTPTYGEDVRTRKIRIMDKTEMRELLKRSPDRMEALVLTFHKPDLMFSDF